jgi:crotonobetainyl-CoA:carnitine CoA-transferase CaiB-like acyl-CoA transferase
VAALEAVDVPAGPVLPVTGAVAAMERAHDGAWLVIADGMRLAPSPLHIDGERLPLRRPPPRLGEHTDVILGELGFAGEEIARLRTDGVVR